MSKISKLRIVNLNYNNNSFKVNDELFYLNGENTMFNLRNGGGKSVLVQMMMAPFVNKSYRNTKERRFESYFTSSTPTYILVEWELEQNSGYVLTGMMVRKKEVTSDDSSKDKLDIINFIYEYNEENDYDIKNIKVVDIKGNKKIVKSFGNTKKLFDDLKKNRDLKFNYYDMNNSVYARRYFTKLQEYKINHKEWETIIKQINMKESGLSELFNNAKDSIGLVKTWLLPNIENKLKKDGDRITNYRKLLESYIKQYKKNKSNIDRKDKIELFKILSEELFNIAEEGINNILEKDKIENTIINLIKNIENELKYKDEINIDIENKIENLIKKIKELEYEDISIKIYKKQDNKNKLQEKLDFIKDQIDEYGVKEQQYRREKKVLECAKLNAEYLYNLKKLKEYNFKLEVLRKESKNNEDEVNDLGFSLKSIVEEELKKLEDEKITNIINKKECEENKKCIVESLEKDRKFTEKLNEEKGSFLSKIDSFNKLEKNFNEKNTFNISRNIQGEIDKSKFIEIKQNILEEKDLLEKNLKKLQDEILKTEKELKENINEKDRIKQEQIKNDNKLEYEKEKFKEFENDIEKRKQILKFLDLSYEKVFNTKEIKLEFNKRINIFREELINIREKRNKIENDINKLKTGKILDMPKEILKKLEEKDIKIIYGMEWLKKNGNSIKKNEEIVKNNPFIPYSLIMEKREMKILENELVDFFTSTPIPIIDKEELENEILKKSGNFIFMKGVRFFIVFNNKLLNEQELLNIINEKENEIIILDEQIKLKKEFIKLYEEKIELLYKSKLTLELYNSVKKDIFNINELLKVINESKLEIERCISTLENNLKEYNTKKEDILEKINNNKESLEDFINFELKYNSYIKNKETLIEIKEKISIIKDNIKNNEKERENLEINIINISKIITRYEYLKEEKLTELAEYSSYKKGNIIKQDKDDLIAKFKALTIDITSKEEDIKETIKEHNYKCKEIEEELIEIETAYRIEKKEYRAELYNKYKMKEIEKEIKNIKKDKEDLNASYNSTDKNIAVESNNLQNLYARLKEKYNKELPKEKEFLIEKNFKDEINLINLSINDLKNKKKYIENELSILRISLESLSEYKDLKIREEIKIEINIDDLSEYIARLKKELLKINKEERDIRSKIAYKIIDIEKMEEFKDDPLFKDPIENLKNTSRNPKAFKEQLETTIFAYTSIVEKLIEDIDLIKKEEEEILNSLLEYIEEVHLNLSKIDENSSIEISGKRLKMLNIEVKDFEENRNIYKLKLKDYIRNIRDRGLEALEKNEYIEDIISNNINIIKLYDEVISISSINIKLYKIEEDKQRKITWEEVAKNSGGEGFLSSFIILSSLLSYIRRDENDIFRRTESGKVLLMDNPFAQTNSAHLLKPLIDIAKKSNTQLICLTGLGGDSIYNRFDNIYVLNLVNSSFKSGVRQLKSKHIKGEEEPQEIISARLKIEDQIKLF